MKEFRAYEKCRIHDDWIDWLKNTSYQLIKQNPSPIVSTCSNIGEMYAPIISELYNTAFLV